METKAFCAYLRVSTLKQKDQNTIENQKILLADYCKIHPNIRIDAFYEDNGISAFKERPQFQLMLSDLNKFDGVIITSLSRIGRSVKQLEETAKILNEKHKEFIVINDNIDTTTPSGMLFYHLLSAFNEYEASLIKEQMEAGRERARIEGKHLGRYPIEINDKELIKLYVDKHLGMDSIAKLKEISKSTIQRRLINQGIKFRGIIE